jgi:hypothetical protein
VLLIAGGFGVGALLDLLTGATINKRNFDRISIGMTEADVEAILGPPGIYFTGSPGKNYPAGYGWSGPHAVVGKVGRAQDRREWSGDKGGVVLWFDDTGRVECKVFYYCTRKLRWWFFVVYDWGTMNVYWVYDG